MGGRRGPGSSDETSTNVGPTTEAELASIQRGTAEDVDAALQAARRAFTDPCWSSVGPDRRGRNLPQIADMGGYSGSRCDTRVRAHSGERAWSVKTAR
ncbi:aldehyde dehydrogenase family protein [Nonomuraea salmonea]|uniref:Aldehyde dehydrogenase family protein n=1 Tax=Nonomuraea salmonea TaxID=46181 RepID=A0ABV5NNX4_9ACTN